MYQLWFLSCIACKTVHNQINQEEWHVAAKPLKVDGNEKWRGSEKSK